MIGATLESWYSRVMRVVVESVAGKGDFVVFIFRFLAL